MTGRLMPYAGAAGRQAWSRARWADASMLDNLNRQRSPYGEQGQMGYGGYAGQAACPPPTGVNVNDNRYSCQASMCAEEPPVCGCNVIGANTFDLAPTGVAISGLASLAIDAGDACRYQPRSLFLAAYAAGTNPEELLDPCVSCPILLLNARVGTVPMIRRTGSNAFGILSDGYSDRKELTCVDWAPFTSIQNQGLTLDLLNIAGVIQHCFVILWGDNLG